MRHAMRWGPLAVGSFRLWFFARLSSEVGNAMAPIALAFAVLDLTGSAAALGWVLAAQAAPTVMLPPSSALT